MQRDFREIGTAEIISVTGGILAGSLLAFFLNRVEIIPGLFIMLPGFLEMRGNISGSLSARLSAALFLKYTKPRIRKNYVLRENVISSVFLSVMVSLVLGLIAFFMSNYIFHVFNPKIIFVTVLAGVIANVIEIPLTVFFTFWLFKHGHDPNNIMGPYVTTIGDIISIASLLIVLAVI